MIYAACMSMVLICAAALVRWAWPSSDDAHHIAQGLTLAAVFAAAATFLLDTV